MTRNGHVALGVGVFAIGLGAGGYYLSQYNRKKALATNVQQVTVQVQPTSVPASGQTAISATVTWRNGSGSTLNYAVQAAIIEMVGTSQAEVAGHMFTSAALAQEAVNLASSGQTAAALNMVNNPSDRLATATVAPGAQGTVTLYGLISPAAAVGPFEVAAWVEPAPLLGTSALLERDSTGTKLSVLASGVAQEAQGLIGGA